MEVRCSKWSLLCCFRNVIYLFIYWCKNLFLHKIASFHKVHHRNVEVCSVGSLQVRFRGLVLGVWWDLHAAYLYLVKLVYTKLSGASHD